MSDLIHDLTPAQVDVQVKQDVSENPAHRFIEMIDAAFRSIYGEQDETISSGDARDVQSASGFKKEVADLLARLLNLFDKNHPEHALIADYVRAALVIRLYRTNKILNAETLAEIDKQLNFSVLDK